MKIKIRRGVFETNSSSQHSLVIKKTSERYTKEEILENMYIYNDGTIHINDDMQSFGRSPFRMLYRPIDKLLYLIASYNKDQIKINELIDIFKKNVPEVKDIIFPTEWGEDNKIDYGYIDHQSFGLVNIYMDEKNVSAEDFIFDKKYIIIIDGDEYCEWDNFKQSGLINIDDIEEDLNPWNAKTFEDYDEEM